MTDNAQTQETTKRTALLRILPANETPHAIADIAAENAIIGSIVAHPGMLSVISDLQPADFANRRNAFLWHIILEMDNADKRVNIVTLPEAYMRDEIARKNDTLDKVTEHIAMCLQTATHERALIQQYAESVMDAAVRIRAINTMGEINKLLSDKTTPLEEILSKADAKWHRATEIKNAKSPAAGDVFQELLAYQESLRAGDTRRIVETGIPHFDTWTGGMVTNQITLLGGYTGTGKTTYMLDMVLSLALKNEPVAVFVDEQTTVDIMRKLAAKLLGIPSRLMNRPLSDEQYQELRSAYEMIDRLPLYIFDSINLQPAAIMRAVRRIERQTRQRLSGVFVDGLYIMRDDTQQAAEWMEHPIIIQKMLNWIQDSGRFLVMTHQLDGDHYGVKKRPDAYCLRGQQILVQRSECIYLLYRPQDDPLNVRVLCAKHRENSGTANTERVLSWHNASESYVDFRSVITNDIPF